MLPMIKLSFISIVLKGINFFIPIFNPSEISSSPNLPIVFLEFPKSIIEIKFVIVFSPHPVSSSRFSLVFVFQNPL
jgi:hypothetical protein